MPPGQFVNGAEGWRLCRSGAADPDHFGIFDMKGLGFVRGDFVRDMAALNKIELLPWDYWGIIERDFKTEDNNFLDRVAAVVLEDSPEIFALYEGNEALKVPGVIHSYNQAGMQEVELY